MQRALRQDIQFLRGFAVLSVVIFHTRMNILKGGYLGVDIFFVISGFLITSMIVKQVREGRFSFKEFYFRRAKRLLPAAYTTFAVTAVLGVFVLTATEFRAFGNQLIGAVTFLANVVLLKQGSYFGGDADFKPLLHTWSLSIEEQYYVIVPALIFFLPRRWWLGAAIVTVMLSLVSCIALGMLRPDNAFYLLPTRAWELGIGSIGALIVGNARLTAPLRLLFWPALLTILVLPILPFGGQHPGIDSFAVCSATIVMILRAHNGFDRPILRPITWVGDISYSLYLVHWPLFALANNMWVGPLPKLVTLAILILSFVLAYAQYRFVERPIHLAKIEFRWSKVVAAATCSLLVAAIPTLAIALGRAPEAMIVARMGNTGFGFGCVSDRSFTPSPACATSTAPTMLVWGDSYAMHLIPGIAQERGGEQIAQATKYVCGPLLDLSVISRAQAGNASQNAYWADGCIQYNREVLEYLKKSPTIRTVVLASVFSYYMSDEYDTYTANHVRAPGGMEPALSALAHTIKEVRALGKKVIVVGPPPALRWDAGLCTERRLRGLPTFGRFADCNIPEQDYRQFRYNVLRFLALVEQRLDVKVVTFDNYLRRDGYYATWPTGKIWYITNGHFSYQGSRDIAKGMKLVPTIVAQAR